MVDVGNASFDFGRLGCEFVNGAFENRLEIEVRGVFLGHRRHVLGDNLVGWAEFADTAFVQPESAVANRLNITHGMRYEKDRNTARA